MAASGMRKRQKRPIYMAKETHLYGKKRPIYMAKETYLHGKRDPFIWQKEV